MSFNYDPLKLLKNVKIPRPAHGGIVLSRNPLADFYYVEAPFEAYPPHRRVFKEQTDLTQAQRETTTLIGVEIEIENFIARNVVPNLNDEVCYYWKATNDGSLRNHGVEYVSQKGLTTVTLPRALEVLLHKERGFIPLAGRGLAEANARTGLHIHMNIGDKDYYDLSNILFLYSVIEPALFAASGNRCDSLFCVPWYQNQVTLGGVIQMLGETASVYSKRSEKDLIAALQQFRWRNYSKYCGLNISTVSLYGTLEFRMHEGTLDPTRIQIWVDTLERLFRAAKQSDLLENIFKFRSDRNDGKYLALIMQVFGKIPEQVTKDVLDDCRIATNNFYKAFVNKETLPELNSSRKNKRWNNPHDEIDFDLDIPERHPLRREIQAVRRLAEADLRRALEDGVGARNAPLNWNNPLDDLEEERD